MSANELLKQVKEQWEQLPVEEREAFLDGVSSFEQLLAPAHPLSNQPLQWPDIHARHRLIFGERLLAENIVLAAREEEDH